MNYHRIGSSLGAPFDSGVYSATAEAFDAQIRVLKSMHDIVTPDDLPPILGNWKKGKYLLITFDDGYLDNYEVAFQILKSHSVPATFFVTTGFLDMKCLSWWDEIAWMVNNSRMRQITVPPWLTSPVRLDEPNRHAAIRYLLQVYKSMSASNYETYLNTLASTTESGRWQGGPCDDIWISWDMAREMQSAGMVIGGHTVSHSILSRMSQQEQWLDIADCARRLQEELHQPMLYFSYPIGRAGGFDVHTRNCLKKLGVRYAFSFYGGVNTFEEWDDFNISRVGISREMSSEHFEAVIKYPQMFVRR